MRGKQIKFENSGRSNCPPLPPHWRLPGIKQKQFHRDISITFIKNSKIKFRTIYCRIYHQIFYIKDA